VTVQKREEWGSRFGFIMAAVGSAIGLGNIWRFPYQAYDNGGGAFLLPYFVALLTAGIPLLILEFGLGHKFRGGAPSIFARLTDRFEWMQRWEWLGWWQVSIAFIIVSYYVVVVGWAIYYTGIAAFAGWGADPKAFFFGSFLGLSKADLSKGVFSLGGFNLSVLLPMTMVWGVGWFIMYKGVQKGIEKLNKIVIPMLTLLVVIITIRALMLPGAVQGLDFLFKPDFSKLGDVKVWTAAYGQIFFSLSLACAIMLTYASYLPKKAEIVNNAFITGFLNSGFSLLAGIMVFAILGSMAHAEGKGVADVVSSGVGLAFITIPAALNHMPLGGLMGFLFFASLVLAGISSFISLTEGGIAALVDKYHLPRTKVISYFCLVGFATSLIFTTHGGLFVLDIVDHFINSFGMLFSGLLEALLFTWFLKTAFLSDHVNQYSDFKVGNIWRFSLQFITPIVLGYMAISNFVVELGLGADKLVDQVNKLEAVKQAGITVLESQVLTTYEGYPHSAITLYGWSMLLVTIALAWVVQHHRGHDRHLRGHEWGGDES
jgi:NSS family neurotransmitter:Na+ symporter